MTEVKEISYREAVDFLLPKHYSGRTPSISYAFGAYVDNTLEAVVTFGKPASNSLCNGICGKEYASNVIELNRVCRKENSNLILSQFISECLRRLKPFNLIVVSYSDTEMNHHGYIYQACNFLYTGATKVRTDKYTEGNKHSRHYDKDAPEVYRKVRSAKHRYVFICNSNKKFKKSVLSALKYPVLPYPKGDNSNYILGEYLKPNVIEVSK